ncbi:MAG: ABC transporter ATP-binding protein [Paenibacillaceae bacterium]|nr:ABC transporter ATP-binding protein [Paenibacillaceae bacterium]
MKLLALCKWLWPYLARIKWMFLLSFVCLALQTAGQLTAIGIQKTLIDDVFTAGHYGLLPQVLLILLGAEIVHATMVTGSVMVFHRNRCMLEKRYGRDLMTYLHRDIPVSVFQKERVAKFVNYYTSDVLLWANAVAREVPITAQQLLTVVVLLAIIGWASPVLLILMVAFSALYYFIGRYFAPRLKEISKSVAAKRSDLIVMIEEGISATREVIAFHRQRWENAKYTLLFGRYYTEAMKEARWMNRNMLSSEPVRWGARVIVFGYGGYLVMDGHMTIGWFILIFQYTNQLMDALQQLFQFVMGLAQHAAYGERLMEAMEGDKNKPGQEQLSGPIRTLAFDRVTFAYGKDRPAVLSELSMQWPMGSKIALVGESGGGKSTIAQLLLRFYEPTNGALRVNGMPLSDIAGGDWHGRIAAVFQEPYLFADTIRHNLLLGRHTADDERLMELCRTCAIDDLIRSLPDGFDTVLGERGITLSGGQRQRLALVRALLDRPDILLLDEATSSLDLETERIVQRNLDQARAGQTTIIIAHRLSTVENADIIYVMDAGRVAEQGTHSELLKRNGAYCRLVHAQAEAAAV